MKTQNLILLGLGAFFLFRKSGGINGNLPSVTVMFEDPKYNYTTSMGVNPLMLEITQKKFLKQ
jgi:hypothetical protein